jgi:hypothetical protein
MLNHRSAITRVLRKLNHHRTTELTFVAFPKTGSTWLRYMLGRYIEMVCGLDHVPLFDATDALGRCERFCVGPAMHFTHRPLLWDTQRADDLSYRNVVKPFENQRVVLLIRHPLDALVSLWMQRLHRVHDGYKGTLLEMIDDPVWGIEKFFRFYDLWFQHRGRVKGFLLVRYEDMRAEPLPVFKGILDYLKMPQDDEKVRLAVSSADFESMKKVEMSGNAPSYSSSGYSIFASGDKSNADALHVRRGQVGGYADHLGPADVERLRALIDRRLPRFFGYASPSP